jgi:ribosomal protein L7/L12
MKTASLQLLERLLNVNSLDAAKAYADAIRIVEGPEFVGLKVSGCQPGKIISCIRELRSIFPMGLKEAKDVFEQGYTWTNLEHQKAASIAKKLEEVGAVVAIT